MKRYILLMVLLVVLTGCGARSLQHIVTQTESGTDMEAQHGHLEIQGVRVPDRFLRVVHSGKEYHFYQRVRPWGRDGYHPAELVPVLRSSNAITEEALHDGYYLGSLRLTNTPENWVYVEWRGGAGFVSPAFFASFVEAEDIPPLPRLERMQSCPPPK